MEKKNYMARYLLVALMALLGITASAQDAEFVVSLLTCSPGDVAYTMFGHSALRVQRVRNGFGPLSGEPFRRSDDWVFNYGVFDYNADSFVYKFVKGETDYVLGIEPGYFFFGRYGEQGATVAEQVLNLTRTESMKLAELLEENYKPENRTYRYNWLYDNCTTRARDMIERCIENGHIDYLAADKRQTAREILHRFTDKDAWFELGIDMILGYELDTVLTRRQQMFIPSLYEAEADYAVIVRDDGTVVPLVQMKQMVLPERLNGFASPVIRQVSDKENSADPKETTQKTTKETTKEEAVKDATEENIEGATKEDIEEKTEEATESEPLTIGVGISFWALFLFVAICAAIELKRGKTFRWIDSVLLLLEGIAGVLIAYLFFCSEHAGVDSNMMVILLNPLAFVFIPLFWMNRTRQVAAWVKLAEVVAFVVAAIITPQCFNAAILPITLVLLTRVVANILPYKGKTLPLQLENREKRSTSRKNRSTPPSLSSMRTAKSQKKNGKNKSQAAN